MAGAGVDFEVGVGHDDDDGEGVGEGVGFEVGGDEQLVVMRVEDSLALGEQAEDIGGELYVAVARGEGEHREAGARGGLEEAGLDLSGPDETGGVVL